jgi:hypothetical protein
MPVIPTYTSSEKLDTAAGSMPHVSVDNAQFEAAKQMGAAVGSLGRNVSEFAAQLAKRDEQSSKFNDGIQSDLLQQKLAADDAEAAHAMPEDARDYTQQRLENFDKRLNETLPNISESQREDYQQRFQVLRAKYANQYAQTEFAQRSKWAQNTMQSTVDEYAAAAANNPDELGDRVKLIQERVQNMPVPEAMKPAIAKASIEQVQAAAAARVYQANPDGLRAAFGRPGADAIQQAEGDVGQAVAGRIVKAEYGNGSVYKNPNSSAAGAGQFLDGTWLAMMNKHRPDLVDGKSQGEILAMRNDPNLSRDMVAAYANDNAKVLSDHGIQATPGNVYLAHFLGPKGAVNFLQNDPSTPASQVADKAAVAANQSVLGGGKTVGDVIAWASRRMGGQTGPVDQRFAGISPQLQDRLIRGAEVQLKQDNAGTRTLMQNDLASIEKTGIGIETLTPEKVAQAVGPEGAQQWMQNRELARTVQKATNGFEHFSEAQMDDTIATLAPTPGATNFVAQQKAQAAVEARKQEIIDKRNADPAGAVTAFDNVKQAAQVAKTAQTVQAREAMIDARVAAQQEIGIDPSNVHVLTDAEAKHYAALLRPLARGQADVVNQDKVAKGIVEQLQQAYGKHAQDALSEVLFHVTMKRDASDILAGAALRLKEGTSGPAVLPQERSRIENEARADAVDKIGAGLPPPAATAATRKNAEAVAAGERPPAIPNPNVSPAHKELYSKALNMLYADPQKMAPYFVDWYGIDRLPADIRRQYDQNMPVPKPDPAAFYNQGYK